MFVVIEEDRHSDTEIVLFSDKDVALAYAEDVARTNAWRPEDLELDIELTEGMKRCGWLRYIRYSCEGDNVRVLERQVRDE